MLKSGIYQIICLINGKNYIGFAVNINKRWNLHLYELNRNIHCNKYLQRAWNKYGEEYFDWEVIEYCEKENLIEKEQYYLNYMQPDYNLYKIAGSCLGYKHTKETRVKLSNKIFSKETRRKISESNTGKINSKRKFSNEEVIEIRKSKRSQRYLAREYGVTTSTIGFVKTYKTYKEIKV